MLGLKKAHNVPCVLLCMMMGLTLEAYIKIKGKRFLARLIVGDSDHILLRGILSPTLEK